MKTKPDLTKLTALQCPESRSDLHNAILASGSCDSGQSFERLDEALALTPDFLSVTLPFVWNEALRATEVLPDIQLLDSAGNIRLTQRQCLCVLSNSFFCTFTNRPSRNCLSTDELPSINFDELYGGGWGSVEIAKLRMLFNYFEQMRQRHAQEDPLHRPLLFIRREANDSSADHWRRCDEALLQPVMHGVGQSIDDAKNVLRVDFANCVVGGAAIAYGCVQEEIMFCECPELTVSRLFCPIMRANEAIVFIGAEQFSQHTGYGASFDYDGPYTDPSLTTDQNAFLSSYIVAIDAVNVGMGEDAAQYLQPLILRELTKAWAGFDLDDAPKNVATGNWGCGVFGGDAELKSVLQWLACCRAGKTLNYFPFDNKKIFSQFPEVAGALISRGVTVGEVAHFLFQELQPGRVYEQLRLSCGL